MKSVLELPGGVNDTPLRQAGDLEGGVIAATHDCR